MAEQELLQLILTEVRSTNEKVDKLDARVGRLEQRMDKLEQRMDKLEQRMDKLERRMDKLEQRVGNLEQRVGNLETTVNQNYKLLESFYEMQKEFNTAMTVRMDRFQTHVEHLELVVCDHTTRIRKLEQRVACDSFAPERYCEAINILTARCASCRRLYAMERLSRFNATRSFL